MSEFTVHTLDLKFQGHSSAIAAFLVEGPDGLILIETGPESTRENLLAAVKNLGFSVEKDIAAVFVTHIHLDHAGAAGWFAGQGIPVYVHHRGAKHLVDPTRLVESARMVYGKRFDSLWGEMQPAPEDKIISLEDGDITEIAGLEIRTIATPGHAYHHHAFAIGSTLFAGDTAGAKILGSDYISVTSAPPQFNQEAYFESLDRLSSEKFERCFLTHFGEIDTDPETHFEACKAAIRDAVLFVKDRLDEKHSPEELHIAYTAFQMERAFKAEVPPHIVQTIEAVNGNEMCADGIRLYLEKQGVAAK